MSDLLEAIYLESVLQQYSVVSSEDPRRLGPLKKVNVFVGANNSGKSRFMRLLAASTSLPVIPKRLNSQGVTFVDIASELRELGQRISRIIEDMDAPNARDLKRDAIELSQFKCIHENAKDYRDLVATVHDIENRRPRYPSGNNERAENLAADLAHDFLARYVDRQSANLLVAPVSNFPKLYIPTLRSLRELGGVDVLSRPTRTAYFHNADHVKVFTGTELYGRVTDLLLGDHDARERIREFETFIGDSFFEGAQISLVPKPPKDGKPSELTIKIGNEKEYLVRELGDGIQSVLILTFPLFEHGDKPLLAFLEEPELYMHPWLQRVFLSTLLKKFPAHQYFLTTHSNHFLDLTLDFEDMSVFTFEKELEKTDSRQQQARFNVTNVSGGHHRTLELLGVRNSSVFLSNCTIWVEGITDRKYLAHWLKLYQEQLAEEASGDTTRFFKEDLHYSFVEYSGANLCHWSLLDETGPDVDRLCGKLFLISDSDGATPESAKGKMHARLTAKLQNDFHCLPVKEIENIIAPDALLRVLRAYGEQDENMKMPSHASYRDKPLGKFIEEEVLINLDSKVRRGSYADGKTISDKVGFSAKAIEAMPAWNSLSHEARQLTESVYKFIQRHNPRV